MQSEPTTTKLIKPSTTKTIMHNKDHKNIMAKSKNKPPL